ncbi:hypothetical protein Rhal01_03623 [Rubritalea halochordaticola]|uniref:Uncharacterized protein n=1 Tax=Rubritalea halochordaticola TaxID=714537 RepID=A0ABP9V437_9BACT
MQTGKSKSAVGGSIVNIPGTKLEVFSNYNSQEKSGWTEHHCSIAYSTDRYEKGDEKRKWLIDLAPLQNDDYKIIFKDGIIVVTAEKGGKEVVKLNLKAIDPGAI